MNCALPAGFGALVLLALDPDVDGAVAAGGVDGVLGDGEGDVVCAIALVNANALTAAAAMILLSMMLPPVGRVSEKKTERRRHAGLREENAGTEAVFPPGTH